MTQADILTQAGRYNWWTSSSKKDDISLSSKLGALMTQGNTKEVFQVFQSFETEDLEESYRKIQSDTFALKSRRKWYLESLLEAKKSHKI